MSFERNTNINTSNAGADSNYLSKQTFVDGTLGSPDSSAIFYHFDAQKRVISVSLQDLVSPVPGYAATANYFYHGNDSLPFKELDISTDPAINDTSVSYKFYNAAGKLVVDSIITSYFIGGNYTKYKTINTFTYNANMIYNESNRTVIYDAGGGLALYTTSRDTITLDSRGNAIKLISEGGYVETFAYDQKPAASLKLNINNIFPISFGTDYEYEQIGSKNNRIYWREDHPTFPPGGYVYFDVSTQYTYLNSGFPSSRLRPLTSSNYYQKFYYQYTSL